LNGTELNSSITYAARMRGDRSLKVFLPTTGEEHKAREHKRYIV